VHEKEVTQTEIHKGQHEWDRISAYGSFYMVRLLYESKKKPPNPSLEPSSPIQFLKQLCRKTTVWILNQNPCDTSPSPLPVQDSTHPTTAITANFSGYFKQSLSFLALKCHISSTQHN